jgi:hypothetical protein
MPNNANIPTITNPVLSGLVLTLRRAGISYASNGFYHYGSCHRTGSVNYRTVKLLKEIEKGGKVSPTLTNAEVLSIYITAAVLELESFKAEKNNLPSHITTTPDTLPGADLALANRKLKLMHRQWDCQNVIRVFSDLMKLANAEQLS